MKHQFILSVLAFTSIVILPNIQFEFKSILAIQSIHDFVNDHFQSDKDRIVQNKIIQSSSTTISLSSTTNDQEEEIVQRDMSNEIVINPQEHSHPEEYTEIYDATSNEPMNDITSEAPTPSSFAGEPDIHNEVNNTDLKGHTPNEDPTENQHPVSSHEEVIDSPDDEISSVVESDTFTDTTNDDNEDNKHNEYNEDNIDNVDSVDNEDKEDKEDNEYNENNDANKNDPIKDKQKNNTNMGKDDQFHSNITLPDVIMAGVQKSGSTALAHWLYGGGYNIKKGLCRPKALEGEPKEYSRKEVHFFNDDENYAKGHEFYFKKFEDCIDIHRMSMDATPNTFIKPQRVYDTYSKLGQENDVKIIITLREPVSREFSWYNHQLKFGWLGDPPMSFDQWVDDVTIPKIDKSRNVSMYKHYLEQWFELFDRRNILLLQYDEVKDDVKKVQWRIQQFLGIELTGDVEVRNANESSRKTSAPTCSTSVDRLLDRYTELNEELYELLRKYPGPEMEGNLFSKFAPSECTAPSNADEVL